MTENRAEYELDHDFLFILSMIDDNSIKNIQEKYPETGRIAGRWLLKLCEEIVDSISQKRIRNIYLTRLVECITSGYITEPFTTNPPIGSLPPLEPLDKLEPEPSWLNDLILESQDSPPESLAKDRRAYLQTKIFEGNRGACAYLAVSVADEGQIPHWIQMGTEQQYDKYMDDVFDRMTKSRQQKEPPDAYGKEFQEYLIDAIGAELNGITAPGSNLQLEKVLKKFMKFIKDKPLGREAVQLTGNKLRHFLLINLQSQFINELHSHDAV